MNENENISVSGEEVIEGQDYIQAINDLKSKTVPKELYQKLKNENKELLSALVNGEQIDIPKEEKASADDLRKKLFNKDANLSNIEYIDTALKLRDTLIEAGERDPFLPYGDKVTETAEQHDKANRVAEVLRECVDFADGDSGIFTAELQRRTKEVMPIRRR